MTDSEIKMDFTSIQLSDRLKETRRHTENICRLLVVEDYSVQPEDFVSPPKWHLGHTTWFFEQFVLQPYLNNYKPFDKDFSFLFNSYYNNAGERVLRPNRGLMTRPTVDQVFNYRDYVNAHLAKLMDKNNPVEVYQIIEVGINHEQQHQELLAYDIKYILGNQPTFPSFDYDAFLTKQVGATNDFTTIDEGIYKIGHQGEGFHFDNELGLHKVYLHQYEIANQLITNAEYLEFMEDGGYDNFNLWHAEGWDWVGKNEIQAPLYWYKKEGRWFNYNFKGLEPIDLDLPVQHISYYEAYAFAEWKGMRLPTEFEWEVASNQLNWGALWEWTASAYLPYPNFEKAPGALGEYNGKFMVSQHVLRGASVATPSGHERYTYRNFFHPSSRWLFSGIRLAR